MTFRVISVLFSVMLAAACDPGSVTDSSGEDAPATGPTTPGGGGTVQRASLTVRVSIDPDDATLASLVGVSRAGLTVRMTRAGSSDAHRTAVTDAEGVVRFDGLLQGTYQLSVDRPLTTGEIALLPQVDRDASIFAGGNSVFVAPPARDVAIALVAARRGSLIISEVFMYTLVLQGTGEIPSHYMEVYNNSDSVVALDGVLVFTTAGGLHSCSGGVLDNEANAALRVDSTGVWASTIYRFPGAAGGRHYLMQPGEARVVAMNAVDLRSLGDGLQDLSRAHFELIGNDADPNNPFAADMVRLTRLVAGQANGASFQDRTVIGLALPIAQDTAQLARALLEGALATPSVHKIPREAVLDATAFDYSPETFARFVSIIPSTRRCEPFVSSVFDRAPAELTGDSWVTSAFARRSLGRTASGAEILQRTRTSSRDFELASPLRRSLLAPR